MLSKEQMYFPQRESQLKVVVKQSHVQPFVTPWMVAHQAPLPMEFFRQEYWRGLLFPSLGNLPNPGIEPVSAALAVGRWILYHGATWEAQAHLRVYQMRPYRGKQLFVLIFIGVCGFTMLY